MPDVIHVPVALGDRSYEIVIATGQLPTVAATIAGWQSRRAGKPSRTAFVITDRHVLRPHAETVVESLAQAGWKIRSTVVEPGEQTKSLDQTARLYDELVSLEADRNSIVIAVGGGVVGDLAGFVAATYARGIPFVQIPTTLLAQVDSSVGGKVGVNHPRAKNLIGAFHQPLGVFIDTELLSTLPDRDFRSGLAEVVKYGVILDADFFAYLEQHAEQILARDPECLRHIVAVSCRLKASVVEQDEYERTGLRAILNYGHTFGHALEALCGYGQLLHGEAVAIGMTFAGQLAQQLGKVDATFNRRQADLLRLLGLPVTVPQEAALQTAAILDCMRLDKKAAGGELRFVLPEGMGKMSNIENVPSAMVENLTGVFLRSS